MYFVLGLGISSLIFLVYGSFYWIRGMYMFTQLDKDGLIREERDVREKLTATFTSATDLTEEGKKRQIELNTRLNEITARMAKYQYILNIADFCIFMAVALGVGFAIGINILR